MSAPNDAAILKRAKEFCELNGTSWVLEFTSDYRVSRARPVLDDRDRRRYITRARDELLNEDADV